MTYTSKHVFRKQTLSVLAGVNSIVRCMYPGMLDLVS